MINNISNTVLTKENEKIPRGFTKDNIETFINSRDMIIIDRKDKSIIAKNISFGYSGGKFNQFLASFYGGGGIKSCGDNISRLDFVRQVLQPTVQKETNNE
ncbi:MAG: hypothetical protein J6W29_06865 [Neisseriaceae bacterium]|nr:hypothetical protein [Neisseriaceae bacterium]